MIDRLTVINLETGDSLFLEPRNPEKSGFLITSVQGLGPVNATIATMDRTIGDGTRFGGSRISQRNIVLSLMLISPNNIDLSIQDLRTASYRFFPIKRQVGLVIENDSLGRKGYIEGYVESNEPDIFSKQEAIQVSIVCPDPYFYKYSGRLDEPIYKDGFVLNGLDDTLSENVTYAGDSPVGLDIVIDANDSVPVTIEDGSIGLINPRFRNTTHGESIRINTGDNIRNINNYKWEKKLKAHLDTMMLKDSHYVVGTEEEFRKELKEFGLSKYISDDFWRMYNTAVSYVYTKKEVIGPTTDDELLNQIYYPWIVPMYDAIDAALKKDKYYHIGTFSEFRKDLKSWGFDLSAYNSDMEHKMYNSALLYFWWKLDAEGKIEEQWHWWEPILDEYIKIERKAKRNYAEFPSVLKKRLSQEFGLSSALYTNAEFTEMYRYYEVQMVRSTAGRYWTYHKYTWETKLEKAIDRAHSKDTNFKFTGITKFFDFAKEKGVINEKEYANIKPNQDPTIREMFRHAVIYNKSKYDKIIELPSDESSKWEKTEDGVTTNYIRRGLRQYLSYTDPNFKPYSFANLKAALMYSPYGGNKVDWEDITGETTQFAVCQYAIWEWYQYNYVASTGSFLEYFQNTVVPQYRLKIYQLSNRAAGGDPSWMLPQYKNTAEVSKDPFRKFLRKNGWLEYGSDTKSRRLSDDLILYLHQIGADYLAGRPLHVNWKDQVESRVATLIAGAVDSSQTNPSMDYILNSYEDFLVTFDGDITAPIMIGTAINNSVDFDYFVDQGVEDSDEYIHNQGALEPSQGGVYAPYSYEDSLMAYQYTVAYIEKYRANMCRFINAPVQTPPSIDDLGMQENGPFLGGVTTWITNKLTQNPLYVFPQESSEIDTMVAWAVAHGSAWTIGNEDVYPYPVDMYYKFVQYAIESWLRQAPSVQMIAGDQFHIVTSAGSTQVTFSRNETGGGTIVVDNANALPWVENWRRTKWPMMHVGTNRFQLDAARGEDKLKATVSWPVLYDGM